MIINRGPNRALSKNYYVSGVYSVTMRIRARNGTEERKYSKNLLPQTRHPRPTFNAIRVSEKTHAPGDVQTGEPAEVT